MNFDFSDLRVYVYIRHKNGINGSDIRKEIVQAFPEHVVPTQRTIYGWIQLINEDKFSFGKHPPPGRPRSEFRIQLKCRIETLVDGDNHLSTRYIADVLGTNKQTVHDILTNELGMRKVCSTWVPANLSNKNKADRVVAARNILKELNKGIADRYLVQDKIFVYWDACRTKQQNKVWLKNGQQKPQVAKPKTTVRKTMLLISFTCNPPRFVVEGLPKGVTVTSEYIVEYLKSTRSKLQKLQRNPIRWDQVIFQWDNARPHTAQNSVDFLTKSGCQIIKQSPYSPDLNACDAFLFTELKDNVRGLEFSDSDDVVCHVTHFLRQLDENHLERQLERLKGHCKEVIRRGGIYITS